MISFKSFLTEEFYEGIKLYAGEYGEVYLNPTKAELKQFNGSIRFIIDLQDKKVYAWNAYLTIHYYMIRELQKTKGILFDLPCKTGGDVYIPSLHRYIQGTIFNGKFISDLYEMYEDMSSEFSKEDQEQLAVQFGKLVNTNMDWIDRYLPLDHIQLKEMIKGYYKLFKFKYAQLNEELISPSTEPNTMSFYHGGNLTFDPDESFAHAKGRFEFGPGLYCTTHLDTARKYAKGSRKLYLITIQKRNDVQDIRIGIDNILEFIKWYVIAKKKREVLDAIKDRIKDDMVDADIFLNIIINYDAIKPSNTNNLRRFIVNNSVDYCLVSNPFGWGEMMIVLFNMKLIVQKKVITPKDKVEYYELPTEWQ